jgi:hypothetical protein
LGWRAQNRTPAVQAWWGLKPIRAQSNNISALKLGV